MLLSALLLLSPFLPNALTYNTLSNTTLASLPSPGTDFDIRTGAILAPILVPRVPGTPGQTTVQHHFLNFFRTQLPKWNVTMQNSTSTTPTSGGKELPFVNIVATRDPPWAKEGETGRLSLVAHYDSKSTPEGFIGATDSAAPCAIILHAARSVDEALTRKWTNVEASHDMAFGDMEGNMGLQILLLDGEEAFQSWTHTDSLYGARSLAEAWERTLNPATSTFRNPLSSIDLFLLLDLLGAKNPTVPSYFRTTHWAYAAMASLESRLRSLQLLKSSPNHPSKRSVSSRGERARNGNLHQRKEPIWLTEANKGEGRWLGGMIEDDHLPFLARGVEILHLIPTPFPRVWHEMDDDGEHLDGDTVDDWAMLITAFVGEWMDLEGYLPMDGKGLGEGAGVEARHIGERERTEL
ncbi:hypothetical protein LTR66_007867 [Elasticomyces elasticus]|nr:hypothetical protein LTR66_007867 [Elasticomyces elasticus]